METLMIAIATKQNITNLLPAIQPELGVTEFKYFLTTDAKHKNWTKGTDKILASKGIKYDEKNDIVIEDEITNRIDKLIDLLNEHLRGYTGNIIFNFGGGQKQHALAFWQTFLLMESNNKEEMQKYSTCYLNFTSKCLEEWTVDTNLNPIYKKIAITEYLNLPQIISISRYSETDAVYTQFYSKKPAQKLFSYTDFPKQVIENEKQRAVIYYRGKPQARSSKDLKKFHPKLNKYAKDVKTYNAGQVFEDYVCSLVQEILEGNSGNIVLAYSRVKIPELKVAKTKGEFDIILLDFLGNVIALELKSSVNSSKNKKDLDARKANLQDWAGYSSKLFIISKLYSEDLNNNLVPTGELNGLIETAETGYEYAIISDIVRKSNHLNYKKLPDNKITGSFSSKKIEPSIRTPLFADLMKKIIRL